MSSPLSAADASINRRTLFLLALTCGVAVGNIYFPQAVSPLVASGLNVAPDSAALVVTAAQFGYAAGNFLLVPLGDRFPHRPLIVAMLAVTGAAMLGAAGAPGLAGLVGASAVTGVTTVVAQVIAPMAAGLVAAERRGAVMGTLLAGSIGGILLARTFGGLAGEWLGWRAPYLIAAVATLAIAAALAFALPATVPPSRQSYPALLAAPLRLLREEPELRRSCLYQATLFGGFQAVWTGLALYLTGPEYGFGAQAVGVLALVSAGTMAAMPAAGRQVDRRGPDPVSLVAITGTAAAAGVLALGALGGAPGLAALGAGTLLLDVAMQSGMIANQARIFALRPDARSRVNTAYMTCAFLGGSTGSWLGAGACTRFGWTAVCALVALLACVALARHLLRRPGGTGRADRRGNAEAKAPSRS
ncbi:MFS transporter [Actinomadura sp. NPDC049753]|uniref:MFS transporter n=1 Tax=Actinomadura sp. NPDC049753 TaxID=3154739 RepID=UPI003449BCE9